MAAFVYADDARTLNDCRKACYLNFLPLMRKFLDKSPVYKELEDVFKNSWPTCQYRCYRCALNGGVNSMGDLSTKFYQTPEKTQFTTEYIFPILYTLQSDINKCLNLWAHANDIGDTTSVF